MKYIVAYKYDNLSEYVEGWGKIAGYVVVIKIKTNTTFIPLTTTLQPLDVDDRQDEELMELIRKNRLRIMLQINTEKEI